MNQLESSGKSTHSFGLYTKMACIIKSKDPALVSERLPGDKSSAWKNLDVAILDYLVLDQILNIGEEQRRSQDNLSYTRSEKFLAEQVDNGHFQLGFLLNATRVEDISAVANARDKMPQKSTYFYPNSLRFNNK